MVRGCEIIYRGSSFDINVESIAELYLITESSIWNQKVPINIQDLFYISADIHNAERVSYHLI
jgi:hypothetical protein